MIGTISNDINFAIGPEPEPSKYLNNDRAELADHGITKTGPKPGKAKAVKEREQLIKKEAARFRNKDDIYATWKCIATPNGGGFNRPCFAVYSCNVNRDDCLGFVETEYYDLICYHCLEQIVKEIEGEC